MRTGTAGAKSGWIRRGGSALVAVLWLIGILAMAAIAAIRVVAFDVDVITAQVHGFRARQLAEAGIAVGINPAVQRDDPLLHQVFGEAGEEAFDVRIASEAGRFNINALVLRDDNRNLLRSLFIDWGLSLDEGQAVVDSLSDWVDTDDFISLNGAEADWYESAGRLNQPFNRPFYSLDEVRLVRGMDLVERVRPDWRDWFTVWSAGPLDVNEARAELIAVAADVSVEDAEVVVEQVLGPDQIKDTEDDARFQNLEEVLAILGVPEMMKPIVSPRLTVNDSTTRIESIGRAGAARQRVTLIVRNRTGRPAILEKFEEPIP